MIEQSYNRNRSRMLRQNVDSNLPTMPSFASHGCLRQGSGFGSSLLPNQELYSKPMLTPEPNGNWLKMCPCILRTVSLEKKPPVPCFIINYFQISKFSLKLSEVELARMETLLLIRWSFTTARLRFRPRPVSMQRISSARTIPVALANRWFATTIPTVETEVTKMNFSVRPESELVVLVHLRTHPIGSQFARYLQVLQRTSC